MPIIVILDVLIDLARISRSSFDISVAKDRTKGRGDHLEWFANLESDEQI